MGRHICKMNKDLIFSSAAFDNIRSDPKQMEAAQCMLTKPLTVVSGRAGTGKTEVAVTVWKQVHERMEVETGYVLVLHPT